MSDQTPTDPELLTDSEREELDLLLEAVLLPGFTARERQIARASVRLARQQTEAAHRAEMGQAFEALRDNGGTQIRSGLAASIAMTLRSMNATREALIARAEAAENELTTLRAEHERLREALKKARAALPDSEVAGPDGLGYNFVWNECTPDEQKWVKEVAAEITAALSTVARPRPQESAWRYPCGAEMSGTSSVPKCCPIHGERCIVNPPTGAPPQETK